MMNRYRVVLMIVVVNRGVVRWDALRVGDFKRFRSAARRARELDNRHNGRVIGHGVPEYFRSGCRIVDRKTGRSCG